MQDARLRTEFNTVVERAIASPDEANLNELWQILERVLAGMGLHDRLWVAGQAITQIVEVYTNRAEYWLNAWEHPPGATGEEPILPDELLSRFLRQTMTLSLDGLLEDPDPHHRSSRAGANMEDSIAGEVDKLTLLEVVDELAEAEAKAQAMAVAHREDVSTWVRAIAQWMEQSSQTAIPLPDLQRSLQMPLIEVWLALLLGGYPLESRGSFYDGTQIWVRVPAEGGLNVPLP